MRGIVDRLEGDFIVVELENEEMINIEKIKAPLAREGDIIIITEESVIIDKEETEKRKKMIEETFTNLFE